MPSPEATPPPPPIATTPQLFFGAGRVPVDVTVLAAGSQESVLPGLPVPFFALGDQGAAASALTSPHVDVGAAVCGSSSPVRCSTVVKKTLEPSAVIPSKRTPSVAPG